MAMKSRCIVCVEVRVTFLALLPRNSTFSCVVPSKSSKIVRANVRLNSRHSKSSLVPEKEISGNRSSVADEIL